MLPGLMRKETGDLANQVRFSNPMETIAWWFKLQTLVAM